MKIIAVVLLSFLIIVFIFAGFQIFPKVRAEEIKTGLYKYLNKEVKIYPNEGLGTVGKIVSIKEDGCHIFLEVEVSVGFGAKIIFIIDSEDIYKIERK